MYNIALILALDNRKEALDFLILDEEITVETLEMHLLKSYLSNDTNLILTLYFAIMQLEIDRNLRDQYYTILF